MILMMNDQVAQSMILNLINCLIFMVHDDN